MRNSNVDVGQYQVIVEPLAQADGGGYVATVPQMPGCMSDGCTRQEALENIDDAIRTWIFSASRMCRPIPEPLPHFVTFYSD